MTNVRHVKYLYSPTHQLRCHFTYSPCFTIKLNDLEMVLDRCDPVSWKSVASLNIPMSSGQIAGRLHKDMTCQLHPSSMRI